MREILGCGYLYPLLKAGREREIYWILMFLQESEAFPPDLNNQDPALNEIVYEYKRYLMRNSSFEPN